MITLPNTPRISLALGFLCAGTAGAQDLLWTRDYGGPEQDGAFAIDATADGGFIVAGYTETYTQNGIQVYLVKTDAEGVTEWSRTFGGPESDYGADVKQTPDGGYAIAGRTGFNGGFEALLVRTDAQGNLLWERTYAMGADDRAHALALTSDGGFVLAGQTLLPDEPPFASYDIYLVKTDAEGNAQWMQSYEYDDGAGAGADTALGVDEVSTGGYILAGHTQSSVWDGWVIRTDALGNTIWDRTYNNGHSSDELTSVQEVSTGGFILGGSYATLESDVDLALVRTDETGATLWTRTFGLTGKDDLGQCVREMPDGGFVLAGYTNSFGPEGYNMFLARTDAAGDTLWTAAHGADGDDRANGVAIGENAIVAAGWSFDPFDGQGGVHLAAYSDPALASCAADFNGDGALNILDFVAFQEAFASENPDADCNADGALNILDFICFQELFGTGCM